MHLCRVQLKFNKCSFYETKEVDNEERQNLKNKNRISVVFHQSGSFIIQTFSFAT